MKTLVYILTILVCVTLASSCLFDKGEDAKPNPCDTSWYYTQIKPIIDINCATESCHIAGTGRADFTTYSGIFPYLDNGDVDHRINADPSIDPAFMPQTGPMPDSVLAKLNDWIAGGFPECD